MRKSSKAKQLFDTAAGTAARYELFAILQFEAIAESRELTPEELLALLKAHYDDPDANFARLSAMPTRHWRCEDPLPPVIAAMRATE